MTRRDDESDLELVDEWQTRNQNGPGGVDGAHKPSKTDHPTSPQLRDIGGKLGRIREDLHHIRGNLRKLGEIVAIGVEALQDAIYDNIEAQAELKIMERVAEIRSIPKQIEAEKEQIETEKRELEAKRERITERYREKKAELDEKAKQRVRDLGEHIFEIMEDEYEEAIEAPFLEHVTDTWHDMKQHNRDVMANRRDTLRSELSKTHDTIDTFLDRQAAFLDEIDSHRDDLRNSPSEPQSIQIPFWVVTVQDSDGTHQEVVPPAQLKAADDNWFALQPEPFDGFDSLTEKVASTATLDNPHKEQVATKSLSQAVEAHSQTRLGSTLTFRDGVEAAFETDSLPVRIEGGETDG